MRVVVTGASGLIGTALVDSLRRDGHEVLRLVRQDPAAADEARWDPASRSLDPSLLDGATAVVHLAGAGVGDKRWSSAYKQTILSSRVDGTSTIAAAVAERAETVKVLVSASAVGYYGERGDEQLDETSSSGGGFLADVVRQWEGATAAAERAGVRVVHVRTGLVLSPAGGLLGRLVPLFKAGVGGRLGSGRQWMPWISLDDEVRAIRWLIDHADLAGPVDLSAPDPVRNADFTKTLGRALHRPTVAAVPAFALRLALAGFADEGALVSQRVLPRRLLDAGFTFGDTDLDATLSRLLG